MAENSFEMIDTSNIESNVVSGIDSQVDALQYSAILKMYSQVVQFAVKTHDERLGETERRKFEEMQGRCEAMLASSLSERHRNRVKADASLIRSTFAFGFLVGALAASIVAIVLC